MASVFVVKGKLENPMEWYSTIEDLSEQEFFGWETSDWIALADTCSKTKCFVRCPNYC